MEGRSLRVMVFFQFERYRDQITWQMHVAKHFFLEKDCFIVIDK